MPSDFDPDEVSVDRNHRDHGGASARPDDDELARRTERERVDAGLDAYDPDDVPPATDEEPVVDPRQDEDYQRAKAEASREAYEGELHPIDEENPFPPTRYDQS